MAKYEIDRSSKAFRRSVRSIQKRGYDISKLEQTIVLLASGKPMPPNYSDHQLKGKFKDYRECHVEGAGDWLLMYRKYEKNLILVLTKTGTHSDLFE